MFGTLITEALYEKLLKPDLEMLVKKRKDIAFNILAAGAASGLCIMISVGTFLLFSKYDGPGANVAKPDMFYVWYYPLLILGYAVREEALYRLLPLSGAVWATYLWLKYVAKKESPRTVIAVAIMVAVPVSAYFGYMHGDWRNIFLQGFAGGAFAYIYLKYGGLKRRIVAPIICSTLFHVLCNLAYFTPFVAAHALGR